MRKGGIERTNREVSQLHTLREGERKGTAKKNKEQRGRRTKTPLF